MGLTKLMIATLDRMFPEGCKLSHPLGWNPEIELSASDGIATMPHGGLGTELICVNGRQMSITRRGKFCGWYTNLGKGQFSLTQE